MICDCLRTKNLPICFESIIIGRSEEIPDPTIEVYFENQATGRIDVYTSELIEDGVIILLTEQLNPILLMADVTYKIWLQDDFTFAPIGTEIGTNTCVYQVFEDYNKTYDEITIQVV